MVIPSDLKQVNYLPSVACQQMWPQFDAKIADHDLGLIAGLGANNVRVFLQPGYFGYPGTPTVAQKQKLSTFVGLAGEHGLTVHMTLFDLWRDVTNINASRTWASAILKPYVTDKRVSVVELKNEMDPTSTPLMLWAEKMLPYIQLVSGKPCTVSMKDSGVDMFRSLVDNWGLTPDFWSYHYYGPSANALQMFSDLKAIAPNLFIGETGQSSYWNPTDPSVQANYFRYIFYFAAQAGLPKPSVWTLWDFVNKGQFTQPWQYDYGLLKLDGTEKLAAQAVRELFAA